MLAAFCMAPARLLVRRDGIVLVRRAEASIVESILPHRCPAQIYFLCNTHQLPLRLCSLHKPESPESPLVKSAEKSTWEAMPGREWLGTASAARVAPIGLVRTGAFVIDLNVLDDRCGTPYRHRLQKRRAVIGWQAGTTVLVLCLRWLLSLPMRRGSRDFGERSTSTAMRALSAHLQCVGRTCLLA